MAAAAMATAAIQDSSVSRRREPCWTGTPEIYFAKSVDNSRLVKVEDPRRTLEMRQFGVALSFLFIFVMGYALQHFKAIEYGYKIEALKSQRNVLVNQNRHLEMQEAIYKSPARIDQMARGYGMLPLQAGQVIHLDASTPDSSAPVMAKAIPIGMISAQ
jgi:hypothetical protein